MLSLQQDSSTCSLWEAAAEEPVTGLVPSAEREAEEQEATCPSHASTSRWALTLSPSEQGAPVQRQVQTASPAMGLSAVVPASDPSKLLEVVAVEGMPQMPHVRTESSEGLAEALLTGSWAGWGSQHRATTVETRQAAPARTTVQVVAAPAQPEATHPTARQEQEARERRTRSPEPASPMRAVAEVVACQGMAQEARVVAGPAEARQARRTEAVEAERTALPMAVPEVPAS